MNASIARVHRRRILRWMALSTTAIPLLARAQSPTPAYPTRPVRIILPYPAGGSADVVTRLVAQKLTQSLGQPVVVENKPGASGNIGFEQMVRSAADGYTLAVVPDSNMTVNPHLYPDMKFDPVKDTAPVALLTNLGIALVVIPSLPVTNVLELIAYSKRTPEGVSYATPGNGTPHHLAGEQLRQMSGANLVHVPYKGGAPALQDLLGGQVQAGFVALAIAAPHVKAGKLRLLAVTEGRRGAMFPDIPTIGETIKGFEVTSWLGMFAPAGTPPYVIARLNSEINKALNEPAVGEQLSAQALDVIGGTPAELAQRVQSESARWGTLIKARNIRIQ